jgi:asparagine synthase (glutamine-hydrolysing)
MCGIFGSVGYPPDHKSIDVVAHRGPDGRGFETYGSAAGPVAMGHRRLAIIDTSDDGLQPMADPSGRYHLVFNGEIYNYIELRDDLKRLGHVFHTATDSEVLLRAYIHWGEAALDRCLGMFAFIVWDEREKRMFAARDRFGIKPLYLLASNQGVALGSEIKQLLGLPGVTARMNIPRVHDFLASGIFDHTRETMYQGIVQVRGGECVVIDASRARGLEPRVRRWYEIQHAPVPPIGEAEAAERFGALLTDSVRLHLRADVPIGSCLSGGLDSSAIVCLMAEMLGSRAGGPKVQTVSACYPEKSVDERPFIDVVAQATGAEQHLVFPKADDVFATASEITWHQDEPFGSSSIFAQWCVFEAAKRAGIKVMLDGQGADEQLAGYHSSFHYYINALIAERRWASLAQVILQRRRYHGLSVRKQARDYVVPLLRGHLAQMYRPNPGSAVLPPGSGWLNSDLIRTNGNPAGAFQAALSSLDLAPVTDIASLCRALTYSSNLPMLLHWEDRNSMAHSVEARVPFVDHRVVEFSLGLGNDHKIVGGDTKRVLRRAMSAILPPAVRDRRDKLGFATPEQIWFRGPLRGLIVDGVEASLRRYPDLFDAAETRRLTSAMLDGTRAVDFTLWRIVNMGIWGDRFGVTI